MSVDRGYLGRAPGGGAGGSGAGEPYLHRSMDDLTFQKTKGLELVRLLRVSMFWQLAIWQNITVHSRFIVITEMDASTLYWRTVLMSKNANSTFNLSCEIWPFYVSLLCLEVGNEKFMPSDLGFAGLWGHFCVELELKIMGFCRLM